MLLVDDELRQEIEKTAECTREESVRRGIVTVEQAEGIDWVGVLLRAVSREDG
ncbi:hypothetical protein ACWEF6_01835 [Amycolatopsis sp. NPDC004772]